MLELEVKRRNKSEKLDELRAKGFLPAVFYGPKEESTSIYVSAKDFGKAFEEAGESTVVVLKDGDERHETLIHDFSVDPLTSKFTHVDFYVIEKGKKVRVHVPIEFVGESPAEKNLGGVLIKVVYEIEIEAMPKDLPHSVEADVSVLTDFESKICARDIKLPTGVELIAEPEEVIALVQEHKEEVEAPIETPDLASIEVEKKGKEEIAENAESTESSA